LASHPELKSRLLKEFWYGGEKIYEVYEIDRSPRCTASPDVGPEDLPIQRRKKTVSLSSFNSERSHFGIVDESQISADFQGSWQPFAKPL
jgi:hypothetical protein